MKSIINKLKKLIQILSILATIFLVVSVVIFTLTSCNIISINWLSIPFILLSVTMGLLVALNLIIVKKFTLRLIIKEKFDSTSYYTDYIFTSLSYDKEGKELSRTSIYYESAEAAYDHFLYSNEFYLGLAETHWSSNFKDVTRPDLEGIELYLTLDFPNTDIFTDDFFFKEGTLSAEPTTTHIITHFSIVHILKKKD